VRLYVFRARKMELEGDGGRKRLAILYQVEPCPASRCVRIVLGRNRPPRRRQEPTQLRLC
jgi:hypothetical protein